MYQDLSRRHDWPVKISIVDLPIRVKGSSKRTSGNSLSPLGTQKKISALLTGERRTSVGRLCLPGLNNVCYTGYQLELAKGL